MDTQKIKTSLKSKFIGIDSIIDSLVQYFEYWIKNRQALESPLIINLWGLTGTAKTALVRKLVNEFQEELIEYDVRQLKHGNEKLLEHRIAEKQFPIVLFDEFPNLIRDRGSFGFEMSNQEETLWAFLNDGTLPSDYKCSYGYDNVKNAIEGMFFEQDKEILTYKYIFDKVVKHSNNFHVKSIFNESNSQLSGIELLSDLKKKLKLYLTASYPGSLIFICGNLDKAYSDLFDYPVSFLDADEIHTRLKKVSVSDCKDSLMKMGFKPEHVSRLGAIHLVMPSLSKDQYANFISIRLENLSKKHSVSFDNSVHSYLLEQGTVASQGMRSLISVLKLLESGIFFLNQKGSVKTLSVKGFSLEDQDGNKTDLIPVKNYLTPHPKDLRELVAAHEAGHALLYYLTTGKAPSAVFSKSPNSGSAGYMKVEKESFYTKKMYRNNIIYSLGGYIAELHVFGEDGLTSGSSSDLQQASNTANSMIKHFGMGSSIVKFSDEFMSKSARTKEDRYDNEVDELLKNCLEEGKRLFQSNIKLFEDIKNHLTEKTLLSSDDFKQLVKKHSPASDIMATAKSEPSEVLATESDE